MSVYSIEKDDGVFGHITLYKGAFKSEHVEFHAVVDNAAHEISLDQGCFVCISGSLKAVNNYSPNY